MRSSDRRATENIAWHWQRQSALLRFASDSIIRVDPILKVSYLDPGESATHRLSLLNLAATQFVG